MKRYLKSWWVWAILTLAALLTWGLLTVAHWFWHPLSGKGYQFWSGIASDISEITLIAAIIGAGITVRQFLHQHFECHEETCHRLGFHHVPGTSHRTCWQHHPVLGQHEKHKVPLAIIHARHHEACGATVSSGGVGQSGSPRAS